MMPVDLVAQGAGPQPSAPPNSGLAALCVMAQLHSIAVDEAQLLHEFGEDAWDTQRILLAAQSLGMQAKAVAQDPERYDKAPLPAVGQLKSGDFFIVAKFNPGTENLAAKLLIQLPGEPPSLRQGYLGIC